MDICDGVGGWRKVVEKWCENWGLKSDQYYKGQGVFETGGMGTPWGSVGDGGTGAGADETGET